MLSPILARFNPQCLWTLARAASIAATLAWLAGGDVLADDRYASPPADGASEVLILYHRNEEGATQQQAADPPANVAAATPMATTPTPTAKLTNPFALPNNPPTASLAPVEPPNDSAPNSLRSSTPNVALAAHDEPPSAPPMEPMAYDAEQEPPVAPPAVEARPLVPRDSVILHSGADVVPAAELKNVNTSSRRLAPPSRAWDEAATGSNSPTASRSPTRSITDLLGSQAGSLKTAGTGLAIVVGLFMACMWLFKPSKRKASGVLPTEAFEVLGRAPLVGQSVAHLLRLGNKLVLVSITPEGAQTLAEVTDPMEVGRLAGLCAGTKSNSPTAEFQQVFAQLSREPARGFLGREASSARRKA